ncbi:hypothetical protein CBP51_16815 [Cellvibrio mixtus]|uniref:Major capsid protein E n=1 Tax=Cellvibrio mixtus TaxID=39650 RepID=A0A266Q4M8_9GAMM|nr:hypothetical protein [Cellvibrio mixtus]OZY84823.1 hypothetical protein CBP51_16815 [Cellvibrio mixtus]
MNNKQVRVIDPILSTVARGYQDPRFVGHLLFPTVFVTASGGQIIEFNKDSWTEYNLERAPGGDVVEVDFGYAGKPYTLRQDSVRGKVPREYLRDAAAVPGIDLGTGAVNNAMSIIRRSQEIAQAKLARDASRYAASNKMDLTASSWNNPDLNPVTGIKLGCEQVADETGFEPTKFVLSGAAWRALSLNPHTLGLFTRGEVEDLIITPAMLAAKLDIEEIAVGRTKSKNSSGVMAPVWGTDAVLAFTQVGAMNNALPSYGYTYTMLGNPAVEQSWYNNGNNSWMYPVNNEYSPVIAGADAGYLFIGAGAAFSG